VIDYCQIMTSIERPNGLGDIKKGHIKYCGIDFYRQPKGFYTGLKDNMRLKIIGELEPKLLISNSLHKHFTKGINWNDITLSNLNESIEILSDQFQAHLIDAKVLGKVEFAVNLKRQANEIYPLMDSYRSKPFTPMKSRNKVYGSMFDLYSKRPKIYDPGAKIEISKERTLKPKNQLTRFELVMSASECRRRNLILKNMSDFFNPIFIDGMGKELHNTFSKIKYRQGLPKDITVKEFEIFKLFNSMTREQSLWYKNSVSESKHSRKRKVYNQLLDRCDKEVKLSKILADEVLEKWQQLSSS